MSKTKILVVDDDKDIVNAISTVLEREGYDTVRAYNGIQALESVTDEDIKLIIIDVMMPVMDGISAIMKIRQKRNIPIIILSAKTEDTDKIVGLSVGADDYISKPYNPMELVARVKAGLRRYMELGSDIKETENILVNGEIVLDKDKKQVLLSNENIKLTAKEYGILELLMSRPGQIFSAGEIYSKVWKEDSYGTENIIMVHIRHLREKIEINPKEPRYIKVVWGIGYKMEKY